MTDHLGKLKEIGIKRRQALLKIIRSLPAAMQKELNTMQVQIGEDLKNFSENNQAETLESSQVIESYSQQINQYIKDAKTEGLHSRRAFLQISSFFTATGLLQFLFVRKAKAGVTIPFAFFKQGIMPVYTYVDDVFSAYTYTGNGATQTITNGIDLAGKGGLVWLKGRSLTQEHILATTSTGVGMGLSTNTTGYLGYDSNGLGNGGGAFNSNGFSLGTSAAVHGNQSGATYVSWSFRKAANFFDIVTYTGDGVSDKNIAHSLGIIPGMIITKRTDLAEDWQVLHNADTGRGLILNTTAAQAISGFYGIGTATTFRVGNQSGWHSNTSGGTYVAYLFAHDTSANGIIQCGSFSGSAATSVNLGWEPQFIMVKRTDGVGEWAIIDTSRGWSLAPGPGYTNIMEIQANSSSAEVANGASETNTLKPTANGFIVGGWAVSGGTYIYMAISRPNKPPTVGTQVYNAISYIGNTNTKGNFLSLGFPADMLFRSYRDIPGGGTAGYCNEFFDRLRGRTAYLASESAQVETTNNGGYYFDDMLGVYPGDPNMTGNWGNTNGATYHMILNAFKRASGVFDIVCYTGSGLQPNNINHQLTVKPELIIGKNRSNSQDWGIWFTNGKTGFSLNSSNGSILNNPAYDNNNSLTFDAGFLYETSYACNNSAQTYVAYLFATKTGISKVGTYLGTNASQNINCGFSAGPRFLMIKRTDAVGDWYVWDSTRGITTFAGGNDPHLSLNTTAAEVTTDDSVDTYINGSNSGFTVKQNATTNLNLYLTVSTASYIYLAIA